MATGRHLVVVAGSDPAATDELADRLRDAVTVRTAYDVSEVLERLDEEVDVVLVDPAIDEDPVDSVREAVAGRGLGCLVALLAARSEGPAGADAVVSPSASDSDLQADVLRLATGARYRKTLEEYYEAARSAASQRDEPDADPEQLQSRLDLLSRRLDDAAEPLDSPTLFRAVLGPERDHD